MQKIADASAAELADIDGVGATIADSIVEWFTIDWHKNIVRKWAIAGVAMENISGVAKPQTLAGLIFVVTGGLNNYTRNHIPYLSLGPNYVENLPDHGDRVGGVIKETGDQVFYWKPSLNSNEKLLVWTAGKGYSYFHNIQDGEKESKWESRISAYVHQLQSSNYPYDMVQLRYTKNADNGPVDTSLCSFVHAWNERYDSPKLVIGNVDSLYQNFEQRYGSEIPVRTGEISPYWEDGAYSTAVEETANRKLAIQTIALDEYAHKKNVYSAHEAEFYQLHRNIILFHEHTWGSWCSISDPAIFFTTEQWRIKKSFLDSAEQQYSRLSKKLGYEYPESTNVRIVKKSKITSFDVDLSTGGITKILVDNKNLISERAPYDFMQFIYAKGISPMQYYGPTNITVLEDRENEKEKYVQLSFDLLGFKHVQVSYSWKKNTNRIVVHVEADKTEELDKESVHIAFPFMESNWKLNYGAENHNLNYPRDQLPGSNKEFICVSKQVELSDEKHKLILKAPAFSLFEVGSIIQEEKVNGAKVWTRENATVNPLYLYVLNNYWHTNYKADQGGVFEVIVRVRVEEKWFYIFCEWIRNGFKWKMPSAERKAFCQSDLVRIQTWNLQSRNLMLYSVELRGRFRVQR